MVRYFLFFYGISLFYSCEFKKEVSAPIHDQEQDQDVVYLPSGENFTGYNAPYIPDELFFAGERIPLEDNDVKERLDRELVVNNFWHSNTIFYLKKANRWFPVMRPILEDENIPVDFLYLAVIESGLMQVTSPSGAKGIWQFMRPTAIEYGLVVNDYVDERMHVEKSTRAACKYLRKAYDKFGSWILAAAAYNRGSAGIVADQNRQKMNDFFDLHLNTETSRYVFRIIAAKIIMENPQQFGFFIDKSLLYPPFDLVTVWIKEDIDDLVSWSIEQGVNYKLLKKFNPWIIKSDLRIPLGDSIGISLPKENEQYYVFTGS